jgi:hypothetical protein
MYARVSLFFLLGFCIAFLGNLLNRAFGGFVRIRDVQKRVIRDVAATKKTPTYLRGFFSLFLTAHILLVLVLLRVAGHWVLGATGRSGRWSWSWSWSWLQLAAAAAGVYSRTWVVSIGHCFLLFVLYFVAKGGRKRKMA